MNEKLLLQDLVILLSKKSVITQKEADRFFRELFQLILESIYENDIVKIKDFGTFKLVKINSRESVDVNTGEKIEIPAHNRMSFIPDRSLKELVNEPFSHFESVPLDDDTDEKDKEKNTGINAVSDRHNNIIDDFEDEDEDDLLEMEFNIENEQELETQPTNPLDHLSFLSHTDKTEKKEQESVQPRKEAVLEKEKPLQEEKPKKKTELIDLIDLKSLPKREIKIEEKKERRVSPPLLDLIDVKRERKTIESRIELKEDTKVSEKTTIPEKNIVLEKDIVSENNIVTKKSIVPEKTTLLEKNIVHEKDIISENNIVTEKSIVPEKTTLPEKNIIPERKDITSKVDVVTNEKRGSVENKIEVEDEILVNIPPVVREQIKSSKVNVMKEHTPSAPSYVPSHFEEDEDINYDYIDYDKLAEKSNKKRKILIIVTVIVVALFAIYQFAKLFNVTHDFEYYINHVPPLTITDSLPMLNEQPQKAPPPTNSKTDTIAIVPRQNRSAREELNSSINPFTEERVESSNLDELAKHLKAKNNVERKSVEISEGLHIKVANKAEVFLSQR